MLLDAPQCHAENKGRASIDDLDFMSFKVAKGATFARVLISPTSTIIGFIRLGASIEPLAASSFYVAETRAEQSVAIVLGDPGDPELPYWTLPVSTGKIPVIASQV